MRYALMNGITVERIIETEESEFTIVGRTLIDVTDQPDVQAGWVISTEGFKRPAFDFLVGPTGYMNTITGEVFEFNNSSPIVEEPPADPAI